MNVHIGKGFEKELSNGKRLDVSVYQHKWFTQVNMSLWRKGNASALNFEDKMYFNWEKIFIPKKMVEKLSIVNINKQSQRVASIDLV